MYFFELREPSRYDPLSLVFWRDMPSDIINWGTTPRMQYMEFESGTFRSVIGLNIALQHGLRYGLSLPNTSQVIASSPINSYVYYQPYTDLWINFRNAWWTSWITKLVICLPIPKV